MDWNRKFKKVRLIYISDESMNNIYENLKEELKYRPVYTIGLIEMFVYTVMIVYIFIWTPLLLNSNSNTNFSMTFLCFTFSIIIFFSFIFFSLFFRLEIKTIKKRDQNY